MKKGIYIINIECLIFIIFKRKEEFICGILIRNGIRMEINHVFQLNRKFMKS